MRITVLLHLYMFTVKLIILIQIIQSAMKVKIILTFKLSGCFCILCHLCRNMSTRYTVFKYMYVASFSFQGERNKKKDLPN